VVVGKAIRARIELIAAFLRETSRPNQKKNTKILTSILPVPRFNNHQDFATLDLFCFSFSFCWDILNNLRHFASEYWNKMDIFFYNHHHTISPAVIKVLWTLRRFSFILVCLNQDHLVPPFDLSSSKSLLILDILFRPCFIPAGCHIKWPVLSIHNPVVSINLSFAFSSMLSLNG
jgi:hypothetical protein